MAGEFYHSRFLPQRTRRHYSPTVVVCRSRDGFRAVAAEQFPRVLLASRKQRLLVTDHSESTIFLFLNIVPGMRNTTIRLSFAAFWSCVCSDRACARCFG